MVVNGNFLKLYNMMGSYRNLLSSRKLFFPTYQPIATLKQSIEEKLGLPPKPKKPKTKFIRFAALVKPSIQEKSPHLKVTEISKIIAQQWYNADAQVKSKLTEEYDVELEAYKKAKAEYDKSMSVDQKEHYEEMKALAKLAKEQKKEQKEIKSLGYPNKPTTAFHMWVIATGLKRGSSNLGDWQKDVRKKWKALPEKDREVFETQAAEEVAKYNQELVRWTEKMIEIERYDLVKYGVDPNKLSTSNQKTPE